MRFNHGLEEVVHCVPWGAHSSLIDAHMGEGIMARLGGLFYEVDWTKYIV